MADQLWIVFLDGVAQTGVLPFAGSEEKALSMWRAQSGVGGIARVRLRAVPKADERADVALTIARDIALLLRDEDADINGADFVDYVAGALDHAGFLAEARAASSVRFHVVPKIAPALAVVQNIALLFRDEDADIHGADFLDFVSRELDQAGFLAEARVGAHVPGASAREEPVPSGRSEALTLEEQAALRAWADEHAPRWKSALRLAWETGNYGGSVHDVALQRIRNRLGPSWLGKYRLPVNPSHETKGYSCWAVTSMKPRQVHTWVATRRAEAVSQVKTAVRNNKTEGGVESKDPRDPFEVTFALVRGKLITTKHSD